MVAHGGEYPSRKSNARRHVAHPTVLGHITHQNKKEEKGTKDYSKVFILQ